MENPKDSTESEARWFYKGTNIEAIQMKYPDLLII
nr:MAG TPA: protein of unknown function (DUF4262) [Bacteriophage sp.]DAP36682.1 MAG TPA: protein of unknown function (DUF4262) [Caudoviricetes sp.]